MCRFVLYLGTPLTLDMLTTRPLHSIINQSIHARERKEPLNGDGFGIAWYVPELSSNPAVFRSVKPAWNNRNLIHLARVTRSSCILAHVRAASPGLPVNEANCHPFQVGRLAFMHNGHIPDFRKIKRAIHRRLSDAVFDDIMGSTDSEHVFALFRERYVPVPGRANTEAMARALSGTISDVVEIMDEQGVSGPAQLNLAVSDGETAVVSCFCSDEAVAPNSLYVHEGMRYVTENGRCRMVKPDQGHEAVLIASEPLSRDPGWDPVPHNHLILVYPDGQVVLRAHCTTGTPDREAQNI